MPSTLTRPLWIHRLYSGIFLGLCLLTGCAPRAANLQPTQVQASPTFLPSQTPEITRTATPAPSLTASATLPAASPTPVFELCSPLEDITLAELGQPDLLKNPFQLPRPGNDDGHHGADFAYWSRGEHKAMLGISVYAALAGRVVSVIDNRQPYGNAVIIETPLENLPAAFFASLAAPAPAPTVQPAASLTCPVDPTAYNAQPGRSLYLLYAHFNKTPLVTPGQAVSCGQTIGEVGTTGKSVNPHLHLETRVGPAGANFSSMSHYDTLASEPEKAAYCTWRVSGLFQMLDPMELLSLQP